jgi:SAM-dependent methyltransferase
VARVLRPDGAFVFLTPNRLHPLSLLNRLLGRSHRLQGGLVRRCYGRVAADAFPTYYRANSVHDLRRLAVASGLRLATLHVIPDPTYLAFTPALFGLLQWLEKRLPAGRKLHLAGSLTLEKSA